MEDVGQSLQNCASSFIFQSFEDWAEAVITVGPRIK